jgi:hypothetical protein
MALSGIAGSASTLVFGGSTVRRSSGRDALLLAMPDF